MKKIAIVILVQLYVSYIYAGYPDTTVIPAKWKNESVVILEHNYRAIETNIDDIKFRVTNRIVYYIRDKAGLQDLSTFNIPTYIVPGAEMQIGKVYKRNKEVIELTTKHLVPMHYKVDVGNRRKSRSQFKGESDQKLAIPNLEVGDILEIEYISNLKDYIYYLYLNTRYNTVKYEINYEVTGSTQYGVPCLLNYRVLNYPIEKIKITPQTITISQKNVEKTIEETLSDDNYTYPYIITWKTCKYRADESERLTDTIRFDALTKEEAKKKQSNLLTYFYPAYFDTAESSTIFTIEKALKKKYKKIGDTTAFLNDLFYYCREIRALNSLNGKNYYTREYCREDRFYLNIFSKILNTFKIQYTLFLTQNNYYGKFEKETDNMFPRYGVYVPSRKFYFFNPFDEAFANRIPFVLEGQVYYSFTDFDYFFKGKKKEKKYAFEKNIFPESRSEDNFVWSEIFVDKINPADKTCLVKHSVSYGGNNKDKYCNSLCSKSLAYENEINPYRMELMNVNNKIKPLERDEAEHQRQLKNFIKEEMLSDGLEVEKMSKYEINPSNFFYQLEATTLNLYYENATTISSAGQFITIDIKHLIVSQLFYKEREKERKLDIYTPYKKQYKFKIVIDMPSGYSPVKLESLKSDLNNSAGTVKIDYSLNNNKLEINMLKIYNFKKLPKEKISDVKALLSTASDFYNRRIVLMKK